MKIVIPMAGHGSRFVKVGVARPKPLIEVAGRTMIQWSVESVRRMYPEAKDTDFIFICREDHEHDHNIGEKLKAFVGSGATVLFTPTVTEGAACTVLLAKELIDNDEDMLVFDSDHFILCSQFKKYRELALKNGWGGLLPTIETTSPKYSYAKVDEHWNVLETREKQVISTHAPIMYYFTKGKYFVSAAEAMIAKNIRHNNEFYMCPVYNEVIAQGRTVRAFSAELSMHLGTPEDAEYFSDHVTEEYKK